MGKNKAIEVSINKSIASKFEIRLKTDFPDSDCYDGIVLHSSKNIVAIREMRDFNFDGLVILNKKHVIGVRDSGYEKCANLIIRFNEEINKIRKAKWMKEMLTIKDVLSYLFEKNIWPAIEIITGKKTALYLGPITRLGRTQFGLYCYDAEGKWEIEYKLKYSDIARIEIDSNYTNNFNRYMKKTNPIRKYRKEKNKSAPEKRVRPVTDA